MWELQGKPGNQKQNHENLQQPEHVCDLSSLLVPQDCVCLIRFDVVEVEGRIHLCMQKSSEKTEFVCFLLLLLFVFWASLKRELDLVQGLGRYHISQKREERNYYRNSRFGVEFDYKHGNYEE